MERRWRTLRQLFRYGAVGLVVNVSGYAIYLLVTWLWLEPKVAVTALYPIGVLSGYFGHARYSFAYQGGATSGLTRYLIAHALGYGTNLALLYMFVDLLHFPHQIVQAAAIFVVAVVLYLLYRFFVFPQGSSIVGS